MLQAAVDTSSRELEPAPSDLAALLPNLAPRLVIVADNSVIAEAVRGGFRDSSEFNLVGYAHAGQTSARLILGAQPRVVLLDDMERSDRVIELLRDLRNADALVALIVLSVQLDAGWVRRLFGAGATAVISKAIHPIALATLVRETLYGRVFRRPPAGGETADSPEPTPPADDVPLTTREVEILKLVASGSTNADVARQLWITEQTVKFHLRNIFRKLDVANRTQASQYAYSRGLVAAGNDAGTHIAPQLRAAS